MVASCQVAIVQQIKGGTRAIVRVLHQPNFIEGQGRHCHPIVRPDSFLCLQRAQLSTSTNGGALKLHPPSPVGSVGKSTANAFCPDVPIHLTPWFLEEKESSCVAPYQL